MITTENIDFLLEKNLLKKGATKKQVSAALFKKKNDEALANHLDELARKKQMNKTK